MTTRALPPQPKRLSKALRTWAAGAACLLANTAWAAAPQFTAVDLADTTVGRDLWQYEYTLTGPLPLFNAFTLQFSSADYADLGLVSNSAPAELDVLLTQPDAGAPFDGQVLAQALTALDASFSGKLQVSFTWLGTGKPGAQPFELIDDGFGVLDSGTTVAVVPEPASAWLLMGGLGLVGAGALRRRRAAA
jgi:PEP-CTERM motif